MYERNAQNCTGMWKFTSYIHKKTLENFETFFYMDLYIFIFKRKDNHCDFLDYRERNYIDIILVKFLMPR